MQTQDTSSCGATQSQHQQSISELANTIHLSCYRRLGELVECCDSEPTGCNARVMELLILANWLVATKNCIYLFLQII